jgi:two-component system response regulator HydG
MDHFRKQFTKRHNRGPCNFTPAVTRKFLGYTWPGNIRQLRNFVETMVVLDTDGKLDLDDLPPELYEEQGASSVEKESIDARLTVPSDATGQISMAGLPSELIGKTMDQIERWAIEETLKMTAGNREEAAKILDIGARTLYRKLDKYKHGTDLPPSDEN